MKYTLITGASSGIGYETALKFAERENNLILVARNEDNLQALRAKIQSQHPKLDVVIKLVDLSEPKKVHQLYEELNDYELQTLINNAGFGDFNQISDQDFDKTEKMIRLNVEALTILTSLFVRDYENVEGTQVINLSSVAGYEIFPVSLTYTATKYYVSAYTEGLNVLLKNKDAKMRAKVLAPAPTDTKFMQRSLDKDNFEYQGNVENYNTPEEMASYLLELYDSDKTIGLVNAETLKLELKDQFYPINNLSGDYD
ncbi:SDR family NAD(P)-dependent oxidoreductase [Staphylococcus carnosus]|uniref:Oxidoreductase n=1 Tax=Staphylococcus carnosus TaxID=1281 RepID=A0AAJ0JQC0_STACA|nr:SDR family NAD(P)-dependent oxidoreductase [Staphylococcus carnosus]KKB25471.1 oxidoreductase [Staphylococcus carnosus]PNZ96802.1 KR domain-containing protein [Staphylococcus carnosus]QQS86263.1 SDR family NAD(P)-dependent oxidoreductase [Staphylococcus carnosus]QRQ06198.1 SDR family NAD(P)-dependent oxidoreductase [Staphylococcus carnosus]UTB81808.1 oxidoreductase [Staphylococcus carnosus]